ncbi:phosphotransferase [Saccharopolyspora hattusasensis]|uniref:phosphotransferase n=1 Tax=Saccharopolyspora hattusasensis TaxID=1128679 RepID=UPI003D951548
MNDHRLERLIALAEGSGHGRVEITSPPLTHATGTVVRMAGNGTSLIGKIHRSRTHHEHEVRAYRDWTSHLADATPELLAGNPDLPGIVITAVPGQPLDELDLSPAAEHTAYHHAGRILRALHQIPVAGTATAITSYLAARAEHWISCVTGHLTADEVQLIRDHMRQLTRLTTARVAACHLDFQPRNLLWHPEHDLRLIDFEHARIDLAARDLIRLATRHLPDRPDLHTAFFTGYGPLSTSDRAVLTHCTALEAATTLAYGLRHDDALLTRHARTLLDTLGAPESR